MSTINPILVVEDDPDLREAVTDTLAMAKYKTVAAGNGKEALSALAENQFSLIISDVQMPGMDGKALLKTCRTKYPEIPFVLITAYGSVPDAVEAIREGAADYIIKPFEAEILIEMVERVALRPLNDQSLIADDPQSKKLTDLALKVARSDVSVMISGESGSGKEVFSRFIHQNSSRSEQPFIAINCAAIPESMLESMLFGYEKGAFTGAYTSRAGKFEQAHEGTLLLDEISEMDLALQAKLLRVLQEKEVERLGGNKPIPLNVRIIATTNRNLKKEVCEGRFREDLFYRLNVFPLTLAPLRSRQGDILPLAGKFIEDYCPGQTISLDSSAAQKLRAHSWPGNIRELENVIQRALVLHQGHQISNADLIFENESFADEEKVNSPAMTENIKENLALEPDLKTREKELIIDALNNNSSRKEAAEKLGISPRTLRYKLAQFRKEGMVLPSMRATAGIS